MIDRVQIQQDFQQNGFVIVPDLFNRDEAKRFKRESRSVIEAVKAETDHPDQVANHGVYVGLAARSPVFQTAVADPRILDILEVVLSPNIEFLSDKVVFKNPQVDFATPWHQDWHYWGGQHKISVWVALDNADVTSGCLKLVSGSHRTISVHDGKANDGNGFGHRLRPDAVDESKVVTAEVTVGDAVFSHDLTLHASYPNTVGVERWTWIPTYRDAQTGDLDYNWAVAAKVVRGTQ